MNRTRQRPANHVEQRLREERRARVYAAYLEAAQDPAFMAEMLEIATASDVALLDGMSKPPMVE